MKEITKEIRGIIKESNKSNFRVETMRDESILISNKMSSIFDKMTAPQGFFYHRPAYFFNLGIWSNEIGLDNEVSIRTYVRAAYLDFLSDEYDAIIRNDDILLDKKYKDIFRNTNIEMGIIYADDHFINDTRVRLKSDADIHRIINVSLKEANRYLGNKVKYIDMNEFVDNIDKNYTIAFDMIKDTLGSDEFKGIYLDGAIKTSFLDSDRPFDSDNYDKVVLCNMDASFIDGDMFESISHELVYGIAKDINSKLPNEFVLSIDIDNRDISISINYIESLSESFSTSSKWSDILFGNNSYISTK